MVRRIWRIVIFGMCIVIFIKSKSNLWPGENISSRNTVQEYKVFPQTFPDKRTNAVISKIASMLKTKKSFFQSDSLIQTKKMSLTHKHTNDIERFVPVDLMSKGPFKFLPNYKNPCWMDSEGNNTDPPIRCLPYFYLIGAPKSGTTDLFQRLVQHQQVSDLVMKEPNWLARKRFCDCSASTMWDNDYWTILPQFEHLKEPLYTNADYIHHLNPKAKLIAILRDPVDRLYSDYLYLNKDVTANTFHIETENILRDFTSCLKTLTLRQCIYKPQVYYSTSPVRLRIGIYHQHLKEYFRVFPREQFFVINLEKFSNDTSSYMKAVFSFLQLSPMNDTKLIKVADPNQHANARRGKARLVGDMKPETRILLQEFYSPHNKELVKLLGDDFNYNP